MRRPRSRAWGGACWPSAAAAGAGARCRGTRRVGVRTSVDGYYGTGTRRSVVTWERRSDVHVDGRFQRRDARVLRAQVAAGTHLGDADFVPGGAAAPEEAAAPMAAAVTAAPAG